MTEAMVADSSWVFDVAEADFESAVLERSKQVPVVVDFWAPWCGPCRALGPVLEKLVNERGGSVLLAKLNVDEAPNLAGAFRIEAIPAVKAFRDGRPVLEFEGVLPEAHLREFFDRLTPSAAEKQEKQAEKLEATNPAEAEKLYRNALEQEPGNVAAQLGLVRLLVAHGKDAEATELLEKVNDQDQQAEIERLRSILGLRSLAREFGDEAALRKKLAVKPDDAELQYQLGCALAAAGRHKEALESLLAAGKSDKKLAQGKVKEAMVKVFHIIGVRSDLADEYRDKLTKILY
jgi:putative thioredoxin